jgi:hypothetical protein
MGALGDRHGDGSQAETNPTTVAAACARADLENPFCALSDYELRHLPEHLEDAGLAPQIHKLLSTETTAGRNAWYDIKDSHGEMQAYLGDLRRASLLASQTLASFPQRRAILTLEAADARSQATRYALILSSINSMAGGFLPGVIVLLVESGTWSINQGLAHARQLSGPGDRAEALVGLVPLTPEGQRTDRLREALDAIRQVDSEKERSSLISTMPSIAFPTLTEDVLSAAREMAPEHRDRTLAALAPLLPTSLTKKVLRDAWTEGLASRNYDAAEILRHTARHLGPDLEADTLPQILRLSFPPVRAELESIVSPLLSSSGQACILADLARVTHPNDYTTDSSAFSDSQRVQVLLMLGPHLQQNNAKQALSIVRILGSAIDRLRLLSILTKIPKGLVAAQQDAVAELVERATRVRYGPDVEQILQGLADVLPLIPSAEREPVLVKIMQLLRHIPFGDVPSFDWRNNTENVLKVISCVSKRRRSELFGRCVELLRQPALQQTERSQCEEGGRTSETASILRLVSSEKDLRTVLKALAPDVSTGNLRRAITLITHDVENVFALAELLPDVDRRPLTRKVLSRIEELPACRAAAMLTEMVETVSDLDASDFLAVTSTLRRRETRIKLLLSFAKRSSGSKRDLILKVLLNASRPIDDAASRAAALASLASTPALVAEDPSFQGALTEDQMEALGDDWTSALASMAPALSEGRVALAFELVKARSDRDDFANGLAALAPHLSPELLGDAIAFIAKGGPADARKPLWCRDAIAAVGPWLNAEHERRAREILKELGEKQPGKILRSPGRRSSGHRSANLAPNDLRRRGFRKGAHTASSFEGRSRRLAPGSGDQPVPDPDERRRLKAAQRRSGMDERAAALAALLPSLSSFLRREVIRDIFELVPGIRGKPPHSRSPPEDVRGAAEGERSRILSAIAPVLTDEDTDQLLTTIRDHLSEHWQIDVLVSRTPYISAATVERVLTFIANVKEERERTRAVEALGCSLAVDLVGRALPLALGLHAAAARVAACKAILGRFPGRLTPLWPDILAASARRPRRELLSDLCTFVPHFDRLKEGSDSLATVAAIQDVGRWWP